MSKRTIAAAVGAALLGGVAFSTQTSAATFTVFGPKDYSRSTGKPEVATDGFSVLNPGSFYVLHVYNGGKTGAPQARASSAVIGLNGVEVVGPAAFNQQVWHIERPVELLPNNQLTVEMRSKPGSGMTIEIIGIDNDPPTIVAVVSPPPNAAGWNNSNVTVSFECGDAHSGIAFCPASVAVASEGNNQTVTGIAVDKAGNTAHASVTVNLDWTPPGITASASPLPNYAGWNNTDVTATFACADRLSGIESCPPPVLVTSECGNQLVLGEARDNAGNTATASASVSLDKTPPTLTVTDPAPGQSVDHSPVTISGTASDAHSGIAEVTCEGTAAEFSAGNFTCDVDAPDGPNSVPIEATDWAGNIGTTTAQFMTDTAELELRYVDLFQWLPIPLGWQPPAAGSGNVIYLLPETLPGLRRDYLLGVSGFVPRAGFGLALTARELKPGPNGALAAPIGYQLQFIGSASAAVWKPIPPPGYVCLGFLVGPYSSAPGTDDMRCVRQDLTSAGSPGAQIGRHISTFVAGGTFNTSWQVVPADTDGIYTGTVVWSNSDNPPSETLYTISARAVRAPRLSSADVIGLIETFGPEIRLHPDDQYLSDNPDNVLDGSSLQWGLVPTESDYDSFTQQLLGQVATSSATLMADIALAQSAPEAGDPSFRTWIAIPDELKPGDLSRAHVLVRARTWNSIFTELQFWVYYPFNGPAKLCVRGGGVDEVGELTGLGRHYSDWEHVSLLVDPRGALVSLYMSRHDLDNWVTEKDFGSLGWQGWHPVIYAAKDSHAHYPSAGNHHYKRVICIDVVLDSICIYLEDWTGDGDSLEAFDPRSYRFVSSAIPGVSPSEAEPDWLHFAGRWGQYELLSLPYDICLPLIGCVYSDTYTEVGAGPPGPAMKTAWKKGDWCVFSGTCQ